MGEEIFSSSQVSYKMDRKSPAAVALRDAVGKKLFDFMGNYTDEVLAEYIVVLVCNRKNQNQARNDLEAFLGQESGKFVAWLWGHLATENYSSKSAMDSKVRKADESCGHDDVVNEEQKFGSPPSGVSQTQPKDGTYDPSYYSTNSNSSKVIKISESILRRRPPSKCAHSTEENDKKPNVQLNTVNAEGLPEETMAGKNTSFAAYRNGASGHPKIPSVDEQLSSDEYQHQKIAKIDSSGLFRPPPPAPRTETVAKGLKSIITEDHQPRPTAMITSARVRPSSTTMDSSLSPPHQIARPRGNVWDRLGKPNTDDEDDEIRGNNSLLDNKLKRRGLPKCQGEELQDPRAMRGKPTVQLRTAVEESVELGCDLEHNSSNVVDLPHVNNSKRKREHSEANSGSTPTISGYKENQVQAEEAPPRIPGPVPRKFNRSQSFKKVALDVKHAPVLVSGSTSIHTRVNHYMPEDKVDPLPSANAVRKSKSEEVSSPHPDVGASVTTQTHKLIPEGSQLSHISESPSKVERHNATQLPAKEELDVKSKLQQIESELLHAKSKLRLKTAQLRNGAKPSALTGAQSHSKEDLESRTVLVTNVHFAATREALMTHFTRCGPVAKVIMLTDTVTAKPKGAAYIVFANKDSVENAVSMSGTSFFSRILTVMRKADMPPDFLVPSQSPWKPVQLVHHQPSWKASGQYSGMHLQWRRDNQVNRDDSISASANGLQSSSTGE